MTTVKVHLIEIKSDNIVESIEAGKLSRVDFSIDHEDSVDGDAIPSFYGIPAGRIPKGTMERYNDEFSGYKIIVDHMAI